MTARPPDMTDRAALDRHRAQHVPSALFLHEIAADQIRERLKEVNRTFISPAIVTGHGNFWANVIPGARIVEDTDTLDLSPGTHDLVIHAMALHWANDPIGQMVQCRRALKPDGLFLSVALGGQTLSELRIALAEAETRLTGGLSPRVAPMAEIRDMGSLLQRAGLALPVADIDPLTVTYRDATGLMHELRAMGETNAMAARNRRPPSRRIFETAARIYADRFPADDPTRIRASFDLIYLSGWAPDESQQKPLRPGSARHRLSDALHVPETPLRDDSPSGGN